MSEEFFEIHLEKETHPHQYRLISGPTVYSLTLNPEASFAFSDGLRRLEQVLVGETTAPDLLRNLGTWLWRALLPENAPAQEREALALALRARRTPLLLALPDTLARLPWELLCDPEQVDERGFVALRRPLVRLGTSEERLEILKPSLRVLLLISSPPSLGDDSRVDVESERAAVEQALREMREAGYLHLLVEDIVTPQRVQRLLVRFKPHIIHYIGHGGYNEASGGILLWEDEQGHELPLTTERLTALLGPRNLRAVVLHACQTGKSNARAEMRGIAEALIQEGIPAVLAQQANLTYESSQRASEAWYTALAAGQSFADALFEVRQALSQAERPDWAVPILQGSLTSLAPLLDGAAAPGRADPLLINTGAVSDVPTPTGVFVGRHRELRELRLMLESSPGSGPVMALITGPGGVGKSTLATQAITHYGGEYKAALTLHCQGYQGIDLFLQRMGEFLRRMRSPGFLEQCLPDPKLSTEAKIEEVIAALNAAGPLLLVIDNLESVQSDGQAVRDEGLLYLLRKLLTNLRGGRVLVTGRYAVKDLLPQGKFAANLRHLDLDDLSRYETNQLLLRHPALANLGETVRATLLDEFGGLPYVYDLLSSSAASQSLDLLIQDVQGRITQARKQRSAQEWQAVRQQVIEFAALDATIQRLSPASRTLLAQLSVLEQPFPLLAIEDGLGATRSAWQPLLDWSLLRYNPYEQKYHLHSLTRRHAENLLEKQSRKQIQAQLGVWYENYASRESQTLPDYLEAHRLLRAAEEVQRAGKLVIQLAETLVRFGLYPLLGELCKTTLNDLQESDELLKAGILHELGVLSFLQGEYEEARTLNRQSLLIFDRLGDQKGRAYSFGQLGEIIQSQGEYEEAQRLHEQSLQIFEQLDDKQGQAQTLGQLGRIAHEQEQYEEARRLYEQSLLIFDRLGDQSGLASSFHQLGMIVQAQGDYEEARRLYKQSLLIFDRLGDQRGLASSFHQLGRIAYEQREYEGAQQLYEQSLQIEESLGNQRGLAITLYELGHMMKAQRKYEEAQRLFEQCLQIEERLGNQRRRSNTLHQLGTIAQIQEKYEEAQRLFEQCLQIKEHLGDQEGTANILYNTGVIAYQQGNYENALKYSIQAYILFDSLKSSHLTLALSIIAQLRHYIEEKVFLAHWRTLAGNRPLSIREKEETDKSDKGNAETLLDYIASLILMGTDEQRQQFAAYLVDERQQLPPEYAPAAHFLECFIAVLRGKTPEVEALEEPYAQLWQRFEKTLNMSSNEVSEQEEEKIWRGRQKKRSGSRVHTQAARKRRK